VMARLALAGVYVGTASLTKAVSGSWPGGISLDHEAWQQDRRKHVGTIESVGESAGRYWSGTCSERNVVVKPWFLEEVEGHPNPEGNNPTPTPTPDEEVYEEQLFPPFPVDYTVKFGSDGSFEGVGRDGEGYFLVSDGLYNSANGRMAWMEQGAVTKVVLGELGEKNQWNERQFGGVFECKNTFVRGEITIASSPVPTDCTTDALKNSFAYTGLGKNILLRTHADRGGLKAQFLTLVYAPFHFGQVQYDCYRTAQRAAAMCAEV